LVSTRVSLLIVLVMETRLIISNLEWVFGYKPRFGITIVDRQDGFKRYPKDSALMLRDIFKHVMK
jgi:beta-glucosidase